MSISKDDLFRRIKADFLQAVRAGGSPNRAELLGKYPELVERLNELFAEVDRTPPHNQPETATLPPDNAGVDEYATLPPETGDQEFSTIVPADKSIALPMTAGSRTGTKVRYFGDYELLSEIARGGMGVVYKARQVNLNRIVALKMILAGQLASEEDVKRFYTEAEAAANLDHPGIVPIFEIGEHDGQHYFSMGFIDGK